MNTIRKVSGEELATMAQGAAQRILSTLAGEDIIVGHAALLTALGKLAVHAYENMPPQAWADMMEDYRRFPDRVALLVVSREKSH